MNLLFLAAGFVIGDGISALFGKRHGFGLIGAGVTVVIYLMGAA